MTAENARSGRAGSLRGVVLLDTAGLVVHWNGRATTLLGQVAGDVLGRRLDTAPFSLVGAG